MSCDKGFRGDCCCECNHLIPIHVCNCGVCSDVSGWVCKIFWEMDKEKGGMVHREDQHGSCEMFSRKEGTKNSSETTIRGKKINLDKFIDFMRKRY